MTDSRDETHIGPQRSIVFPAIIGLVGGLVGAALGLIAGTPFGHVPIILGGIAALLSTYVLWGEFSR